MTQACILRAFSGAMPNVLGIRPARSENVREKPGETEA
jgi:hypothetical protein